MYTLLSLYEIFVIFNEKKIDEEKIQQQNTDNILTTKRDICARSF